MATRDLIAEAGARLSGMHPPEPGPVGPDPTGPGPTGPDPIEPDSHSAGATEVSRDQRAVRTPANRASQPADIAPADAGAHDVPTPSRGQVPCWVALHFPALPLMVCDFPEGLPGVVIHETGGQQLVHAACPLAADLGVSAGMPLNAAHVLCRNLVVRLRDPLAEYRWLKRQSELVQRFTPMVSLGFWETGAARSASGGRRHGNRVVTGPDDNADTLLMEVSGSLRLFGGLETMLTKARALFAAEVNRANRFTGTHLPQTFQQPLLAVAPAPAAALLLARNGREAVVRNPLELRSVLGGIAVSGADIDARLAADLGRCGLDALRDLWRLPPTDLGRRFGSALPDYLNRLVGEQPEVAARRDIAPRFRQRMALPADTRDSGMILLAAEKLLLAGCRFLTAHAAAAEEVVFDLWHVDRGQGERGRTRLCVHAARAGRRPQHFLPQLAIQLERQLEGRGRSSAGRPSRPKREGLINMPAAIEAVSIRLDRVLPYSRDSQDLFQRRQDDQPDWAGLMDLLTARLGRDGVYRLAPVADHRPERAMRRRRVVETALNEPAANLAAANQSVRNHCQVLPPRPLWLLSQPRSLADDEVIGDFGGLAGESERIEAGWWDRMDMRRDYGMSPLKSGRGAGSSVAMGWIYRRRGVGEQARTDPIPPDRTPPGRTLPGRTPPDVTGQFYLHGLFG